LAAEAIQAGRLDLDAPLALEAPAAPAEDTAA
jgi:hypothetical protein